MTATLFVICSLVLGADSPEASRSLQYLKPSGGRYVLESAITEKKLENGRTYRSVTHRGATTMDLTISWNNEDRITGARIVLKTKSATSNVRAELGEKRVRIVRGDKEIQSLPFTSRPVLVTTAPDWSDIILLLRRYDQKKGGKQSFRGLWFHPTQKAHLRDFTVEKIGSRALKDGAKNVELAKFEVTLRSGAYVVWADRKGVVHRLRKPKQSKGGVVLKGFEKLTEGW